MLAGPPRCPKCPPVGSACQPPTAPPRSGVRSCSTGVASAAAAAAPACCSAASRAASNAGDSWPIPGTGVAWLNGVPCMEYWLGGPPDEQAYLPRSSLRGAEARAAWVTERPEVCSAGFFPGARSCWGSSIVQRS